MTDTMGGNSQAQLRSFVARLEDVEKRKKACAEDRKLIMAEARSSGFKPPYLTHCVRKRALKPEQRQEQDSLVAVYEHAVGLAQEPPVFRQIAAMTTDANSRDKIIELFKKVVSPGGEIIVKLGGKPVRIWRDKDGNPQVEPWIEPSLAAPAEKKSTLPPKPDAEVPNCTPEEAQTMGSDFAKANRPITDNPFPFGDPRQERFETGWKDQTGNDGMGEDD